VSGDQNEAVDAFEQLGLTSYEAKVFIALHRLGAGTARDVAEITDVPRSQVYSVAESLENRGLLEVQQSNPIRYRPVSVDEARDTLRTQFERERDRAFEYVETVKNEPTGEETQEDIWTVRGRNRVDDRTADILAGGRSDRLRDPSPELVTDSIERAIAEARRPVSRYSSSVERKRFMTASPTSKTSSWNVRHHTDRTTSGRDESLSSTTIASS